MSSKHEHHFELGEKIHLPFEAPVDIRLGPQDYFKVIDPRRDLQPEIASQFAGLAPALFVARDQFDYQGAKGYEEIWPEEPLIIGRHSEDRIKFSPYTSTEHIELELNGNTLSIHDLGSQYGTMARWAIRSARSQLSRNREEVERQHENYNVMLYGATEKSERRPGLINDDAFFIDKSTGALGVFDGVGGAEGSDVASATAAHSVEQFLRDIPYNQNRSSADKYVVEAAVRAHHAILDRQQTDEPIQTTATIAKVFLDTQTNQPFVSIASVGDSRAYLYRNGHLEAITIDQGIYFGTGEDDQRRMQAVLSEVDDPADLTTQEEYDAFRYRHTIVGALGGYDHNPPVTSLDIDVQKGDRIILTTDGIHDNLTTSELQRHLLLVRDDSAVAAQLIAAAQARSRDSYHLRAKPDDMTVAIMTID